MVEIGEVIYNGDPRRDQATATRMMGTKTDDNTNYSNLRPEINQMIKQETAKTIKMARQDETR